MGLDITAYRRVKAVRPRKRNDPEDGYSENLVMFYNEKNFPGRFEGLQDGMLYSAEDSLDFRAGSYSGYNLWREWLAVVADYPSVHINDHRGNRESRAASCWNGEKGPFSELIDFSDCEGTIGPVVAAKLARDFAAYDDRAKGAAKDGWFYEQYTLWRAAFEMASDGGAVDFH